MHSLTPADFVNARIRGRVVLAGGRDETLREVADQNQIARHCGVLPVLPWRDAGVNAPVR